MLTQLSTIWSWRHGEPRNTTGDDDSNVDPLYRCATVNRKLDGRWVVDDCSQKYYAACRAAGQPYNWTITSYPISYSYAANACPDKYSFGAPRTALENSHLVRTIGALNRDFDGNGVWIDFNSLDVEGCWNTGGANATCPYENSSGSSDNLRKRTILVPTVAALIVLVLTALTVFVKVAGNRKIRKRSKRRAKNGFVYEGVPS